MQLEESSGRYVQAGKGHIMISYNWRHRKEVIKIADKLRECGYAVWMDVDNMGDSSLKAMAEAVEHAHTILICMSQEYKGSLNCRTEAEYAFQLRKKIIPLKMENGYTPDGWLGLVCGARLFLEFSGKYPFERKIEELKQEIANTYTDEDTEPKVLPERDKKNELSNSAPATGQLDESSGRHLQAGKGHIMISHNWGHQKELIKIRDILKEHGYAVWMDIDKMSGSVSVAMAKAVEEAHVILICMSQKYKDSVNCKAEAEYAFSLKKKIIFLMMEEGYKPDGWLGFLFGVKPYIDFSGKDTFEEKIQYLVDAIAEYYKNEDT